MSDAYTQITIELVRILIPINIFLGAVGNTLNIIILTRPRLFKYASSHFFLAIAINNLFGSIFVPTNEMLSTGYQINLARISPVSCKLVRFFSDLCALLSFYFIVLASIDRYFASSPSASRRRLSSIRNARFMILTLVTFFALIYINTLVLTELDRTDRLGCVIRPRSAYYRFYAIFQVIIYTVLAPCLMIFFGLLTIANTQKMRAQTGPAIFNRRTERQLSLMLLVQVGTHLSLTLPICVFYLMLMFLPSSNFTSLFYFIFDLSKYLFQFSFSTAFFLYIITGQTFQKELIYLVKTFFCCFSANQVQSKTTGLALTASLGNQKSALCQNNI